ncbi:Histidinol-phosphate aminotransferase [Candidatus Thermoflexus japonica]|uniref:Histidinol-phosphate aminotransferase n=1 Tax=Candidatus Thermoflexus japonica TaxID=2035417 RepID=A0A2H5Y4B4_9CHLR|nr:Histidinol-phosphate aminotransferase [Candidatus Thermoflexus japonica]
MIERWLRADLRDLLTYSMSVSPEDLAAAYGVAPDRLIRLHANENVYGPSPRVYAALARGAWHQYPDPQGRALRRALAEYTGLSPEWIALGNGADDVIDLLARLLVGPGRTALIVEPTFEMYALSVRWHGGKVLTLHRDEAFRISLAELLEAVRRHRPAAVFLASPNNPDGALLPDEILDALLAEDVMVIVDEAYFEFSGHTFAGRLPQHPNLVIVRTFSKWAGLAALRLGYALMHPELVRAYDEVRPPFHVNLAAQQAALASLEDRAYLLANVARLVAERERLYQALQAFPFLRPFPSRTNFILCRVIGRDAHRLWEELLRRGILIRRYTSPELRDYLRISVGRPEHTEALLRALTEIVEEIPHGHA